MFIKLINTDFTNHKEAVDITINTVLSIQNVLKNDNLKFSYDVLIFVEVLKKTQHDLRTMSNDMGGRTPNIYKQYATFAYWLKRLKPFNERKPGLYQNYTNETIALTYAFSKVNQLVVADKRIKRIPAEFLNNTMYIIRFEQISKYGMLMLLTAMFEIQ